MPDYNYSDFDLKREQPPFEAFPRGPLQVGARAPDFALEDLGSARTLRMKELWVAGTAVVEFGSFT